MKSKTTYTQTFDTNSEYWSPFSRTKDGRKIYTHERQIVMEFHNGSLSAWVIDFQEINDRNHTYHVEKVRDIVDVYIENYPLGLQWIMQGLILGNIVGEAAEHGCMVLLANTTMPLINKWIPKWAVYLGSCNMKVSFS